MKTQILALTVLVTCLQSTATFACLPSQGEATERQQRSTKPFSVPESTYKTSKFSIDDTSITIDNSIILFDKTQNCWALKEKETEHKIYIFPVCIRDNKVVNRDPVTGELNAEIIVDDVRKIITIYPTDSDGNKISDSPVSRFYLAETERGAGGIFTVQKNGNQVSQAIVGKRFPQTKCGKTEYEIEEFQNVVPIFTPVHFETGAGKE